MMAMKYAPPGHGGPQPGAGRPSVFNEEIAEHIASRIEMGETVRDICYGDDMPDETTVGRWQGTRPEFAERIARARAAGAYALAEETIRRARSANDVASASASRAFTDAMKLLLPAFNRSIFGQKQDIQVTEVRRLSDDELRLRTLEALAARPELIPMALARAPHLEPELRARGLLGVEVIEGSAGDPPAGGGGGGTSPIERAGGDG